MEKQTIKSTTTVITVFHRNMEKEIYSKLALPPNVIITYETSTGVLRWRLKCCQIVLLYLVLDIPFVIPKSYA